MVTLYLDGWSAKAIPGYLETSRQTVYEVLRRWDAEGWPGLADRSHGPRHPARKVDLKAMAAIRRLQANPELPRRASAPGGAPGCSGQRAKRQRVAPPAPWPIAVWKTKR